MGGALQWRDGRSAKELAKAWCSTPGAPSQPIVLRQLLDSVPELADLVCEIGYPEHRLKFDDVAGEPRNADIAVACRGPLGAVAMTIEAKADESFGRSFGEEIVKAAAQWAFEEADGKLRRTRRLADLLLRKRRRPGQARLADLKYQLLTAVAGTWAFAAEINAAIAVCVIHEFVSPDECDEARLLENHQDLTWFVERLTGGEVRTVSAGQVIGPLPVPRDPRWPNVDRWYLGKCRTNLQPPP